MTTIDSWIERATRGLSKSSRRRVRAEIEQHMDCSGAENPATLGDPADANRLYRDSLPTTSEACILFEGNWEAHFFCSVAGRLISVAVPVLLLLGSAYAYISEEPNVALTLCLGSLLMGILFLIPRLPIYTPFRARVFRIVKTIVLVAVIVTSTAPMLAKMPWLPFILLWSVFWPEWKRMNLRRKLPINQWPKQLYL